MIFIFNLFTQICTATALFLVYLANEWLTVGFGLNPWIAIPVATLLMVVPHIANHYLEEVDDTEGLTCIIQRPR
jgi:hypothetical protein